jgi:hypothetical protein
MTTTWSISSVPFGWSASAIGAGGGTARNPSTSTPAGTSDTAQPLILRPGQPSRIVTDPNRHAPVSSTVKPSVRHAAGSVAMSRPTSSGTGISSG